MSRNTAILIPVLNPNSMLTQYVEELIGNGFTKIIVVNDGSGPEYRVIFEQLCTYDEVDVLVHDINKGKGRAIKTALQYYLRNNMKDKYNGVITVDADGQHILKDVLQISELMKEKESSLILGERGFDKDVPFRSKFGNYCTKFLFNLMFGTKLHDTQTGLRGIPNKLIDDFKELEGERYEYETNMLIACSRKNIPITSVEITTVYINNNEESHFNPFVDSYKIYKLIFKNFGKYIFSSLSASIIDIGIFQLALIILQENYKQYILFSTVIARIVSSLYNYFVNRTIVFKSQEKIGKTMFKYYALCAIQMMFSAFFVTQIYSLFPFAEAGVKIVVDTILFFVSYQIQRRWIFLI